MEGRRSGREGRVDGGGWKRGGGRESKEAESDGMSHRPPWVDGKDYYFIGELNCACVGITTQLHLTSLVTERRGLGGEGK